MLTAKWIKSNNCCVESDFKKAMIVWASVSLFCCIFDDTWHNGPFTSYRGNKNLVVVTTQQPQGMAITGTPINACSVSCKFTKTKAVIWPLAIQKSQPLAIKRRNKFKSYEKYK